MLQRQFGFLLVELELLYDDWEDVLVESHKLLFGDGVETFAENRRRFESWWRDNCEVTGCHPGQESDTTESVVTEDNVIEGDAAGNDALRMTRQMIMQPRMMRQRIGLKISKSAWMSIT